MAEPVLPNPIKGGAVLPFKKPSAPKQAAGGPQGPIEIMRQSAQREMPGGNTELMLKQIALMIQRNVVKLLQLGNTVFLLYPRDQGTVEFHTFTTESPQDLIQRYKAGVNSLRQLGYKKAVSYASQPGFVKIAKATGLPVRIAQEVRQGKPVYRFEVDL